VILNSFFFSEPKRRPRSSIKFFAINPDFFVNSQNGFYERENVSEKTEIAVLGAGCFWCTEAIYKRLNGVLDVEPGYAGGHKENPTYEEVCTGTTGHAEVARIKFNPEKIGFDEILKVFWSIHDPTSLNKQGNDEGEQYRSVIFYVNKTQREIALRQIAELEQKKVYKKKIVTAVESLRNFYPAEDYHKAYFETHKEQPYCAFVIAPKVKKFENKFSELIKKR
jgi:peptide-methionine (S)-S-oxide reductase